MIKLEKVLSVKYSTKIVKYIGVYWEVPSWTNYIATDEDGEIFAYKDCPYIEYGQWQSDNSGKNIGVIEFTGDWKESLEKVL